MTDAPERIWIWRNEPNGELVVSGPDEPYPSGSPEYVRADLTAAVTVDREAIEEILEKAEVMVNPFGAWVKDPEDVTDQILSAINVTPAPVAEHRQFLWDLLDNIDTLDDACKDNDKAFREAARKQQQRRFEISTSDGYKVTFNDVPGAQPADNKNTGDG